MSTASVTFELGETASASKLMSAFNGLQTQGSAIIDALSAARTNSLVSLGQKLEALNGRRQRANRMASEFVTVNFVTSDLLDIDQTLTSATVRADTQSVTLKERSVPSNAVIQNQTFRTSAGTAELISTGNTMFRVHTDDGSVPTGTFTLQFQQSLSLSVLTFDLAAMSSTPVVSILASSDGVTFAPALDSHLNGYRLTAWFAPMEMRYVSLAITPTIPDSLGGTSFTFGLTDFIGAQTEFQLLSDLVTLPISFSPQGTTLQFVAAIDPGLTYFIAFNGAGWQETAPGPVSIPGTTQTHIAHIPMNGSGLLAVTLPLNVYPGSISVIDESDGSTVRKAPGLSPTDANLLHMAHDYVATNGQTLNYISHNLTPSLNKTFTLSYVTGPATETVQLKVQLSTSDRTLTPTFTGASLQEI